MRLAILSAVLAAGAMFGSYAVAQDAAPAMLPTPTAEKERATPIPPPPEDRSNLPAPRAGVVMVKVGADGRLNVPLGGWGGQRIIQAKKDPEAFRAHVQRVKERGLNLVRPLFHPPNAAKKNDSEWAQFDWEAMDRVVAITQEEGVYMLVDYHNWLVNDAITNDTETWLKTWGWIVDRYKPYQHLIFEGFNEPIGQKNVQPQYQQWLDMVRAKGAQQLCVVSPFWEPYFGLKDPASNWAQCRHHYANHGNSSTVEKAQKEIDWQLANPSNKNSAASAVKTFGCGFFMTEGGIDDKPKTDEERAARIAGVQRIIDVCEKQGYGWCLWADGDWAHGMTTYGTQLTTSLTYPSITGGPIKGK